MDKTKSTSNQPIPNDRDSSLLSRNRRRAKNKKRHGQVDKDKDRNRHRKEIPTYRRVQQLIEPLNCGIVGNDAVHSIHIEH